MQIQLSQKERMFLEDGKIQEEVCVEKYKNYSQQAGDAQLKNNTTMILLLKCFKDNNQI